MAKSYLILYEGRLAERHLTRKGAEARAFILIKEKRWDASKVEIQLLGTA